MKTLEFKMVDITSTLQCSVCNFACFYRHSYRMRYANLTTTISHFKRLKTQSHSDYEISKFETKAGTMSKSSLGSSNENKCLVRQSIGRNGHCAR